MIPINFFSKYSCVKLVILAGSSESRIVSNMLVENYNFLNYNDFFSKFSSLTSSFSNFNILFRVFLFIPDSKSENSNYFFFIKNIDSKFLFLNFLLPNSLIVNKSLTKNFNFEVYFNDYFLIYKIVLILNFFLNISLGILKNFLFLKYFKKSLKSFLHFIFSFQFLYFLTDNKDFNCFHRKFFYYKF